MLAFAASHKRNAERPSSCNKTFDLIGFVKNVKSRAAGGDHL